MDRGLLHFSDEIRVRAFDVLVSSRSSRQPFTPEELEAALGAFRVNVCIADPAVRQEFAHSVKKMMQRMFEGMEHSVRSKVRLCV